MFGTSSTINLKDTMRCKIPIAPESTIQFECATCALFITTGAMNMDMSVRVPVLELA